MLCEILNTISFKHSSMNIVHGGYNISINNNIIKKIFIVLLIIVIIIIIVLIVLFVINKYKNKELKI